MLENSLQNWARMRGYGVAWGPLTTTQIALGEITERRAGGEFDERFYREELAPMAAERLPSDGTIVVVAKPRGASRLVFELAGGAVEALLPPTYARYRAVFEDVRQDLAAHGLPGARVEHLAGPIKAVASHLGLVRYGRNNVTYLPGAGSYIQLCGYRTDARLEPAPMGASEPRLLAPFAPWAKPASVSGPRPSGSDQQLLARCEGCTRCLRACPTRAIDPDRVLLRAERCLTFVNEHSDPWPDWLPAGAHRCLIGCLVCQRVCPENPELPLEGPALRFTEDETRALLASADGAEEPSETGLRMKLAWLGRADPEPLLGRNLRALIEARSGRDRQRDPLEPPGPGESLTGSLESAGGSGQGEPMR